jgi:hypothetical protein
VEIMFHSIGLPLDSNRLISACGATTFFGKKHVW